MAREGKWRQEHDSALASKLNAGVVAIRIRPSGVDKPEHFAIQGTGETQLSRRA